MESSAGSATARDFMPNGGVGQKTTGESITSDSSSPLRSDEKVQSRYLSPRVDSCHDFCKYGKKQDSDTEARRMSFRNFLKNKKKSAQNAKQNEVTILVAEERRIKTGTKPMNSSSVKTEFPDDTEVSKPQASPATKNRNASGGKKTPQASIANEQATKPKATSKIEAEVPNNAEVPNPQTPQPKKNCTVSDPKKMLQTSTDNEQGRARIPNPADGNDAKANIGGTPITPLQSKHSPTCEMETSEQPNIIEKKTKSSVRKHVSPVAPKGIQQKASPSMLADQQLKPKVPPPHKRVDGSGKTTITLKTKAPLIRSLSQRKSSKSLIAQSNQETKVMRSPGTSKNGGGELSKPPTTSSFSKSSPNPADRRNHDNKMVKNLAASKIGKGKQSKTTVLPLTHDNSSSLQLKKLRSIKRTSIPHENVWSSQLRKLKSTKRNSAPQDTVSGLQPRKLKSIKQTSTPPNNVSSLQPRKLRSIKRTSTPHESVSSLQTRKLRSTKQTSTFRDIVSRFQPRKLRSMKRSSSVKDKEDVGKDNRDSKSGDDGDLCPDTEMDESESAIYGANDEEKEGNEEEVDDSEIDHEKKWRGSTTAHAWPEDHTATPFKLKFKRGKVINLRSDSIGARRLWFNIGRLASENPSSGGLLWRRGSRRKSSASIDFNDPDSEVQSVVLKHQGVAEKKDSKSLFNHVIEETASKLVETRKSKVKALVGAFETVISLQESKPASTA